MMRTQAFEMVRRAARMAIVATAAFVVSSCTENLPVGPNQFVAHLSIVVPHDTVVVGDQSSAQANVTDDAGHVIQSLSFVWTTTDSSIIGIGLAANDTTGRTKALLGRRTGRANVGLSLPDPRFTTTPASRTQTVVVGGVQVLSTHDSTLTAVNDTGVAIAAGLIRASGALVAGKSEGVRWTHLGTHTTMIGTGDTIRYVAQSNGVDTLIASHDFCLAGGRCADTAIVRVSPQLTLSLSAHSFRAWSFSDSLGPSVTLADRRGNGVAGTTVRFVPVSVLDASVVRSSQALGVSNPTTGLLAAPKLISIGNGTAHVTVQAIGADGVSVVATDTITETVRQVARRAAIEPLTAVITANDRIPIQRVARDARGAPIADATVDAVPAGINLSDIFAGATVIAADTVGTIAPVLSGIALPENNPGAPQLPVLLDTSFITMLKVDTAVAGTTSRTVTTLVTDSLGRPAAARWVRFGAPVGPVPDSVRVDVTGTMTTTWVPFDSAGFYTLTGVRGAATPLNTVADSAGRIVVRRSILVIPDVKSSTKSTAEMSATHIAVGDTAVLKITVRDRFGNLVSTATPTDFTLVPGPGGGTFGPVTCILGVCTATYTAPAGPTSDVIAVRIGGTDVLFSPIGLTIF